MASTKDVIDHHFGRMGTVNGCGSATVIAAASHDAVIRVYDEAGNVIETLEQGRGKSLPVS